MKRAWTTLRLIVAASAVATSAALPARGDYLAFEIASHEAMSDYTRFESRSWAADAVGEGGRLERNTVWSGGEHVIVSDIYIPSGVTLTINAGTVVKFREGTRIKVEDGGSLVINGASGNEVVLEGYDDDTRFTGIVLQSSAANYSDNTFVIVRGFNFGRYATVSLNNTTAFLGGGQALVPVDVSGSRDTAFSFDWVAETNGVTFASGTMNWNRVSDGRKNITVPYPDGLPGCSNFMIRAVTFRCCSPNVRECVVTLSEFITTDIFSHETMADYIAFESREWAAGMEGEGGRLATNATWSGKHTIVSDVYIPSGVTLTLTADTVVEFCEGTRIKIEDGGTLNIVGADGHDVILRGAEGVANFGGIVKMPNGTFTDNSYFRFEGFTYGALANVALHDSSTFRSSGLALIPVTVSGSRSTAFSIDWVAETNGAPYKTGTLKWNNVSEGTKNISINYGAELDGYTNFTLRAAVDRACKTSPNTCTIKMSDFIVSDIASHESMAEYIRFESRDWAADLEGEGGRLATNATWEGTHKIASDVYIPSGVTLTLVADAVVEFYEGTRIKIEDGGTLNIGGANGHDVIIRGAEGVTNYVGIVKMPNGTYTDNMYVQYTGKPYSAYPYITVHEATTYREAGKMWIAFSLSGTTRNQSFNVDWSTDKGDSGTLTWSSSSDGTKWIEIPIAAEPVGGTTNHVINVTAARGCNISVGTSVLTVLEPDYNAKGKVALTEGDAQSNDFAVNGGIKTQPLFLSDVEKVQYSGKWQPYDENEAAVLRVTLETDNGATVLKEASPSETGAFDLNLKQYPVGYYTLRHEVLNDLGETLATMQKTFSIADEEDVVLHGGVLASNEVWAADKVHVVYETVVVPSIYTIFIEPGAIVKFMTGTGIDISQGGAFFANRIVFTHINDDTVGGDTLSDGFTVAPPMDAYFLSGAFTFGDDTELRGITQNNALTGTIATQKTLSRGSTYRVSGTLTIASGGSLTIPPGTVLKMEDKAAIVVNSGATLNAVGTRAAPITFTSIKDDTISGDTNGDGSNTIPQPGDWVKIGINGGTANFEFTKILYSSKNQTTGAINQNGGTVVFCNSEISHGLYDAVGVESGNFYMTNSIITDCLLAFRHWAKDPIVNSVIYDCGRLTQGGGQTFYNCVFSEIAETWEAFGFPKSTYKNCCFWNENGSVLTGEGTQDALTVCGSDGNIWGDPLFVDPVNGDFRVKEGSPCVDAADGAVAPELDFYGQPRITITDHGDELVGQLADIGICEVMPRDVVSDIDLVPQSVRTTTNAVPGQLLFVKWEIVNVGGREVEAAWRDTVSLVSESGREVVLGVKMTSSRIGVGGSVFCSGYFTVPAISEGTWYLKVNVNSYHDIFEGSLAANNALVGDRAVIVGLEALDPSSSREGMINGGTPTVLKLAFDENDDNRMVKFNVPAGVKVTWGFGFMPQGASKSGAATATGDGVMFRVPDGATDVYVVLESDTTATYNLSTESTKMMITDVTPSTLPSSGTTTLTIAGAGFGDTNGVTLISSVGRVVLNAPQKDASGNLIATVDCAALTAGQTYAVRVESGENAADLPGAVSVVKADGKGHFWARLVVPDSVRQGRKCTCYVEYGNDGNADISAQVLQIGVENGGKLQYVGNDKVFDKIHFIAATSLSGHIPSGTEGRVSFVLLAGSEGSRIVLYAHVFENAKLQGAYAALHDRGADCEDYRLLANELSESTALGSVTHIAYAEAYPEPLSGKSLAVETSISERLIYLSAKNLETFEIYNAHSLSEGKGLFYDLPDGLYKIVAETSEFSGSTIVSVRMTSAKVLLEMRRLHAVSGTVSGAPENAVVVFDNGENAFFAVPEMDSTYSLRIPEGVYDVFVFAGQDVEYTKIEDFNVADESFLNLVPNGMSLQTPKTTGRGLRSVATRTDWDDSIFESKYTQARKRADEGIRLLNLAYPIMPPEGEYDCPHNQQIYLDNYKTAEIFRIKLFTYMNNSRLADPWKAVATLTKAVADTGIAYIDKFVAGKAKIALKRYGKWAGGIYNAKNMLAKYSVELGSVIIGKSISGEEVRVDLGKMANDYISDIDSLAQLLNNPELSLSYTKNIGGKLNSILKQQTDLIKAFEAARNARTIIASDVDFMRSSCIDDPLGFINAVGTIVELIDDWFNAGEAIGEWGVGRWYIDDWMRAFENELAEFAKKLPLRPYLQHCCDVGPDEDIDNGFPSDTKMPNVPRSCDPNEMRGKLGLGDPETQRFVKPGEELTYTIYFENKTNATAAAQEVYVTNPLNEWLDWSTFKMHEVAFGDQIDLGLVDKSSGTSEVTMKGTNFVVRTELVLEENGDAGTRDACPYQARWYMRIVDPTTDTGWPTDIVAGFLPPNDETHRGEGHITYSICVRADAPANLVISNSADIVFDHNPSIKTDPAWWNTIAGLVNITIHGDDGKSTVAEQLIVGTPYGDVLLPTPKARTGYTFIGWFTGPNGTGRRVTADSLVEAGDKGLYAFWTINKYKLTLTPNSAKYGTASGGGTYAYGATATLKAAAKKGYVFAGWFTDKACTKSLNPKGYDNRNPTVKIVVPAKNTTIYAKFVSKAAAKKSLKFSSATKKLAKTAAKATAGKKFSLKLGISSASLVTVTATGLPKGLKIDKATGAITGTATVVGDFTATVTVKDAAGNKITQKVKITVRTASYAKGTFYGTAKPGKKSDPMAYLQFTVGSTGKVSGKVTYKGKAHSFKATLSSCTASKAKFSPKVKIGKATFKPGAVTIRETENAAGRLVEAANKKGTFTGQKKANLVKKGKALAKLVGKSFTFTKKTKNSGLKKSGDKLKVKLSNGDKVTASGTVNGRKLAALSAPLIVSDVSALDGMTTYTLYADILDAKTKYYRTVVFTVKVPVVLKPVPKVSAAFAE